MSVALHNLPPEHTFVFGKDQATARALLDAAEALGHRPEVVRTVDNGFLVPDDVWDRVQEQQITTEPGEF